MNPAQIVKCRCPDCGEVQVTIDQVVVRFCVDDGAATYVYRCPTCERATSRPANAKIVAMLITAGVVTEGWRLPAELDEPVRADVWTLAELDAFEEALHNDVDIVASLEQEMNRHDE